MSDKDPVVKVLNRPTRDDVNVIARKHHRINKMLVAAAAAAITDIPLSTGVLGPLLHHKFVFFSSSYIPVLKHCNTLSSLNFTYRLYFGYFHTSYVSSFEAALLSSP